ncbi:lysostaphin resistance A-like protein, partial [candidate division CSSED10-310 bacterium]
MLRKPIFWIIFSLVSIGCVIFAVTYFPVAFPIVNIDLQMNREMALENARTLALKHNWGPESFTQAASFQLDSQVRNFVELRHGGNEAFRKLLQEGHYMPYTWQVRHFKENETNETLIKFTPQGKVYGFSEKLPQNEPGATLESEEALLLAEETIKETWRLDLTVYELIEKSKEVRPGGRIDHTFVYERPNIKIGEGRFRLRLVVGGDRLTELTHFLKIPESFSLDYKEMRSANNTITSVATIAIAILYVIGGCIIGLFYLLRNRWVIWRKALFWGVFVAFMQVLANINQWPLAWMDYDTALSFQGFFLRQVTQLIFGFVSMSIFLTLIFMAAESLTRKAFPHHIRFWQLWSRGVANSVSVLGRTAGAYLSLGLKFAFVIAVYIFSTRILGWWVPSDVLFEPDILATYFPWLTSISISLMAGFMEECLFRAVPLAGAALIGQRLGYRRSFIIIALILQAVIFGAGHASYPTQPAYARVVELIIPSMLFYGGFYLMFGLLPAIILHYTFDVIAIGIPLLVASSPGIWIDKVILFTLALVPFLVVLYARIRAGAWSEIQEEQLNRSWQPKAKKEPKPVVLTERKTEMIGSKTRIAVFIGGVLGFVLWIAFTDFKDNTYPVTINRNKAEAIAQKDLYDRNIKLQKPWRILSSVKTPRNQEDRFIWQEGDPKDYQRLMGNYLAAPYWRVRFARFEGSVSERAEEYQLNISSEGAILRFHHQVPEVRPGADLSNDEARVLVDAIVKEKFKLETASLKSISEE